VLAFIDVILILYIFYS